MPDIRPLGTSGGTKPVCIIIDKDESRVVIPYSRKKFTRMFVAKNISTGVQPYLDVSPLLRCGIQEIGFNITNGYQTVSNVTIGPGQPDFFIDSETENSFTLVCPGSHNSNNGVVYLF